MFVSPGKLMFMNMFIKCSWKIGELAGSLALNPGRTVFPWSQDGRAPSPWLAQETPANRVVLLLQLWPRRQGGLQAQLLKIGWGTPLLRASTSGHRVWATTRVR